MIIGALPHVNTADTICAIYNIATLCLNGTLSCVDFMAVIMGDIPIMVVIKAGVGRVICGCGVSSLP